MGLTLITCFRKQTSNSSLEILPAVAQQLLVNAGSYIIFEVAYLDVNRLVLT